MQPGNADCAGQKGGHPQRWGSQLATTAHALRHWAQKPPVRVQGNFDTRSVIFDSY